MNATETLLETITTALAPSDKAVLDSRIASIAMRREAKAAIKKENFTSFALPADNFWAFQAAQVTAVGGKGWSELLRNGDAYIIERLTAIHANEVEARNAKIASKLTALNITEVIEAKKAYGTSTFYGTWHLTTDAGRKNLEIEMILAGGYNIQCLHNRVLVKIK